jgi:hypothetical protein
VIISKIKKNDDKADTLRLSKAYSEQNRKLQRLEQELREQKELQESRAVVEDEDHGLLEENQLTSDVEYQVVNASRY